MTKILYLHGFLSSPASIKVGFLRKGLEGRAVVTAPDLNTSPMEADRVIRDTLERLMEESKEETIVIGSSLGGFFAARVAAEYELRAVLLNPCLNPWERVVDWVGHRKIYGTNRTLDVFPSFAEDFRVLNAKTSPLAVNRPDTLVVLSTADEVLPWKMAERAFDRARLVVLPGEDHRISGFDRVVPRIVDFCLGEANGSI